MKIYAESTEADALEKFAQRLGAEIAESAKAQKAFNLSLSGGDTAKKIFEVLRKAPINWGNVNFYWVDERCVAPELDASNYRHAKELLFDKIGIPENRVFRMRGEECPISEMERYAKLVAERVPQKDGFPVFDCSVIGVGPDFHTASIFPNTMKLLNDEAPYAVNQNPETGQWRMTMTGRTILNSKKIFAAILGERKGRMFQKLLKDIASNPDSSPAAYVLANARDAEIFTDIKQV